MAYGKLNTDIVQSSTAGTPPQFNDGNSVQIGTLCRAWVNFNGTGTVAIRSSFNVSSITDNGTGNYTVNFTTAMPDANYSAVTGVESVGATNTSVSQVGTYATTSVNVFTVYTNTTANRTLYDASIINVSIFR